MWFIARCLLYFLHQIAHSSSNSFTVVLEIRGFCNAMLWIIDYVLPTGITVHVIIYISNIIHRLLLLKLGLYDINNIQIYKRNVSCLKPDYSIWFVTPQSFWFWVSTRTDVCQQANIVRRKIVAHSGPDPATFGLQIFCFPYWATADILRGVNLLLKVCLAIHSDNVTSHCVIHTLWFYIKICMSAC